MLQQVGTRGKAEFIGEYDQPSGNNPILIFQDVNFPLNKLDAVNKKLSNFKLPVKVLEMKNNVTIHLELNKPIHESSEIISEFEKYYESIIREIKD